MMKAGDVSEVRTSTRETWLSTPLSDPNAALWASITPPANPTLSMLIQRHARAFSLDMLAHRLYVGFPGTFSSRASARLSILGSALALAAAAAGVGYLALEPASFAPAAAVHAPASLTASSEGATSSLVRLGETAIDHATPSRAPTLAASAAPVVTAQVALPLTPRAAVTQLEVDAEKKARAKSTVVTKKVKGTTRRAAKPRRARAAEP